MQIGNKDLDRICDTVIFSALRENDLVPNRIDKHNKGELLQGEILAFIADAKIIIADLTNERPNCYLEIGYAYGLGKTQNVILTCREDHKPEHPSRKKGYPKVHFDLSGYDILFWSADALGEFKKKLSDRIAKRITIVNRRLLSSYKANFPRPQNIWDMSWLQKKQEQSRIGLAELGYTSFLEVWSGLEEPLSGKTQKDLLQAALTTKVKDQYGYEQQLGGVLMNRSPEFAPKPNLGQIDSEIKDGLYQNWALKTNGDCFLAEGCQEDYLNPGENRLNWEVRLRQFANILRYFSLLYKNLHVSETTAIALQIRMGGLKGKQLQAATYFKIPESHISGTDTFSDEIITSIKEIDAGIVQLTKSICIPFFMLFNYFEVSEKDYELAVTDFHRFFLSRVPP